MSDLISAALDHLATGKNLTQEAMRKAIGSLMQDEANESQIAQLLTSLAEKGETVEEVAGAALAMREHMIPLRSSRTGLVDTCGTGGGGSPTFNISTTAAIVAAAAGAPVAKHGNRSVTSRTGSADVLAELGVNIEASIEQVEACLDELGLCFCFAPLMHPAMQYVGAVRKRLGIRTIFNLLGPLANPANAEFQLLGAGRPEMQPILAGALERIGTRRTLVVSGEDGLGDVTINGSTHVTEITADGLKRYDWTPEDFGIDQSGTTGLAVEGPAHSAAVIRKIFRGTPGAARNVVVLNAAAALLCAELADSPSDAAAQAARAIDSGAAAELLAKLAERSHAPARS